MRFSSALAVHDRQGVPTLHLRMVNERTTPILDAHLHVGVLIDESEDEHRFRRFVDLDLARNRVPIFGMAFTAMHALDPSSPLYELRADDERLLFLLVTMRGIDASSQQPVFARAQFHVDQVRFGMGFANMVTPAEGDDIAVLDMTRIDELVPRTLTGRARPG